MAQHNVGAAELIILGTLASVYSRGQTVEAAMRNLREHAKYCREQSDDNTAVVADGVADELGMEEFPELTLHGDTVKPPDGFTPKHEDEPEPASEPEVDEGGGSSADASEPGAAASEDGATSD